MGSSNLVTLAQVLKAEVGLKEIKDIIRPNYPFIVIGSISVIYWRIGNIMVSKILTLKDVADYDISLKLWSMAVILPIIISASVFPLLIRSYKRSLEDMKTVYKKAFLAYGVYGLIAYTFVFSYSDFFIPFLFGEKYTGTSDYCKEMFLTILLFPTAILQANVLIAIKLEKFDMWINLTSLVIYLLMSTVGFYYVKSLSVINYGIFFSFFVFHILQDFALIKLKITTYRHACLFYIGSCLSIVLYYLLSQQFNGFYLFFIFWSIVAIVFLMLRNFRSEKKIIMNRGAIIMENNNTISKSENVPLID